MAISSERLRLGVGGGFGLGERFGNGFGGALDFVAALTGEVAVAAEGFCLLGGGGVFG